MSRQSKRSVLLTTVANSEASPRDSNIRPAKGLAKLYRQMLFAFRISPTKEWSLMNGYLDDPFNGIKPTSKRRASARSNLMGALTDTNMSFRTFLRGCRLLRMEGIKITVEPIMAGNFTTKHSITLDLNDPDLMGAWNDEDGGDDGDDEDSINENPATTPAD